MSNGVLIKFEIDASNANAELSKLKKNMGNAFSSPEHKAAMQKQLADIKIATMQATNESKLQYAKDLANFKEANRQKINEIKKQEKALRDASKPSPKSGGLLSDAFSGKVIDPVADTARFKLMALAGGFMIAAQAAKAAVAAVSSFIEASNKQEFADKQLESSLKATGRATPLKEFKEFASYIQNTTTYGDEEVQSALKLAATFKNLSDGSMKDVVKTATNVASALGTDLDNATKSVAQALARPEQANRKLRAMNIILTKSEEDKINALVKSGKTAEAQAAVMDVINSKYAGMAEATAGTTAGMMKQTKNLIGDTKEQIGNLIKDMIQPIMRSLIPALKNINKWFTENKDKIGSVIDYIRIGLVAIPPILLLIKVNSLQAAAANVTMGASTGAITAGFKAAAVASKAFLVSLGPILVATLAIAAAVKMAQWYDDIKKTQEAADASIEASNATWQAAKTRAAVMRQAAIDIRISGKITKDTLQQMQDAGIEDVKITKKNAAEKIKMFELAARAEDEKYRKGAEAHKKQVADSKKTNKEITDDEKAAYSERLIKLEAFYNEMQDKMKEMTSTNPIFVDINFGVIDKAKAKFTPDAIKKALIAEQDLTLQADIDAQLQGTGLTEADIKKRQQKMAEWAEAVKASWEGVANSLQNNMGSAIDGLIDRTQSLGQAFRQLAVSVVSDIAKMITKMLIYKGIMAGVGFLTGGTGTIFNAFASVFRMHNGGFIHAAGGTGVLSGGISGIDSIPVLAMAGEGVLNRAAVNRIGGEQGLNRLNNGGNLGGNLTVIQQIGVAVTKEQEMVELERTSFARAKRTYDNIIGKD